MAETSAPAPVELKSIRNAESQRIVNASLRNQARTLDNLTGRERKKMLNDETRSPINLWGKIAKESEDPKATHTYEPGTFKLEEGIRVASDSNEYRVAGTGDTDVREITEIVGFNKGNFICKARGVDGNFPVNAQVILNGQLASFSDATIANFPTEVQEVMREVVAQSKQNRGDFDMTSFDAATLTEAAHGANLFNRNGFQASVNTYCAEQVIPDDATGELKAQLTAQNEKNAKIRDYMDSLGPEVLLTEEHIIKIMELGGINDQGIAESRQHAHDTLVDLQRKIDTYKIGSDIKDANGNVIGKATREVVTQWEIQRDIAKAHEAALSNTTMESLIKKAAGVVGKGLVSADDTQFLLDSILKEDYDKLAEAAVRIATNDETMDAEAKAKLRQKEKMLREYVATMRKMGGIGGGIAMVAIMIMMMSSMKGEGGGH